MGVTFIRKTKGEHQDGNITQGDVAIVPYRYGSSTDVIELRRDKVLQMRLRGYTTSQTASTLGVSHYIVAMDRNRITKTMADDFEITTLRELGATFMAELDLVRAEALKDMFDSKSTKQEKSMARRDVISGVQARMRVISDIHKVRESGVPMVQNNMVVIDPVPQAIVDHARVNRLAKILMVEMEAMDDAVDGVVVDAEPLEDLGVANG